MVLAALASSNVFASDAITTVMGNGDPNGAITGPGGSLYYNHRYNIFYNPSYANDAKNWLIVERNAAGTASGGFVGSAMNMSVGAFFNRNSVGGSGLTTDPIDIIVAGDAGIKWGANLSYSKNRGGPNVSDTSMAAKLGAQIGDIHPFIGMQFVGNDKVSATATNKTTAFQAGVRYMFGEWNPYAYVKQTGFTPQGGLKAKSSQYGLGVGRTVKAGEMSSLSYSFGVHGTNAQRWTLPIDLVFETEFTSWLVGRAGVNHRVVDRTGGVSNANNTTGRAGGTFKFGKAEMDFAVGGAGGDDSGTNGLFTTVALVYHW